MCVDVDQRSRSIEETQDVSDTSKHAFTTKCFKKQCAMQLRTRCSPDLFTHPSLHLFSRTRDNLTAKLLLGFFQPQPHRALAFQVSLCGNAGIKLCKTTTDTKLWTGTRCEARCLALQACPATDRPLHHFPHSRVRSPHSLIFHAEVKLLRNFESDLVTNGRHIR